MSKRNSQGVNYPERVTIDDITFTKSPDELYLELRPEFGRTEVDQFFDERSTLVQSRFEPEDRKELAIEQFNRSAVHGRWVTRAGGREETIDALLGEFEVDEDVRLARPVYFREDLPIPNGFTFGDQIIVRCDEEKAGEKLQALFEKLNVERVEGPRGNLGRGLVLVRIAGGQERSALEVARQLAKSDVVEAANVDIIQLHSGLLATPNDTFYGAQWNLRNIGQLVDDFEWGTPGCDINAEPAWDISRGSPLVVIAILDTGCDLAHEDLLPNYVQPDRWYNAVTGTNSPDDGDGHGTKTAGVASAVTNSLSAQGAAGVGWHCRIMPVRALRDLGLWTASCVASALQFARANGANVINMSFGWDGPPADVATALQECFDDGIVLVAASGNSADQYPDSSYPNGFISYPASDPNVIAVGATDENDRRVTTHFHSQFGTELSVVAPGVHIWTPHNGGGYAPFFGTSAAAPHVAGLAGLILAYNPTLTPTQVRTIIETTADDQVGDPAEDTPGWDKYMGHGRINAGAALLETQTNYPFTPVDVYIRDSLSDSGLEPCSGWPLCYSPDIITRQAPVADPQTELADMTVDPGSDPVGSGNDNYVYVRVHSNGATATHIHVRVYFAPLNTTCGPELWEPIGQIDFYDVPAGGDAVSDALVWEHVPDPGLTGVNHYCIIASIEGFGDPHPDPVGISSASQYMQFIRDHNNICYRNLTFVNALPDTTLSVNFLVGGFLGDESKYELRIVREELARRALIDVELHEGMLRAQRILLNDVVERANGGVRVFRRFTLGDERQAAIRGLVAPGPHNPARLEVKLPADAKPGESYEIHVQQVFEGEVIGDFALMGRIVDPRKVKYIAVRGHHLVHKAGCDGLAETDRQLWVPFESLGDARVAGYDMALDCLNQPFEAKDVSHRLARKVLHFVNTVELADDLRLTVKDTLGIGYFEGRYGKQEAKRRGYGIGIDTAREIVRARHKVGRFTRLEELEAVEGVGIDKFIDLVNTFK